MRDNPLLAHVEFGQKTTLEEIASVENDLETKFPLDYKDFLLENNGGEGFINEEYIVFWAAGELVQFNIDYEVSEQAPGLILFGSNGCGEAYAYDLRELSPTIVMIPFIGMDLKYAITLAHTFEEFLIALADKA